MTGDDFRFVHELQHAWRNEREFAKARGSSPAAKIGLRYERNVGKELARHIGPAKFSSIEHNPWFRFTDYYGTNNCSPDFLLWDRDRCAIIEIKLTWVPAAMAKLCELYCPVVSAALQCKVMPLVICRNLTPQAPKAEQTLVKAMTSVTKLLHWPQIGHIPWD
jgi:hypothetical protein